MTDLVYLLSRLVTPDGKILVPGIMDQVAPLTGTWKYNHPMKLISEDGERQLYEKLEFAMDSFHDAVGAKNNIHPDTVNTLMHRFVYS
jgi:Cys-Gly metallodipeptidase DUG1